MHILPLGDLIQWTTDLQNPQVKTCPPPTYTSSLQDMTGLTYLRYGHYTLVVCVVGTILIMAFGHNTLAEHARFIPVYAMGSSFVTAAWPSLEESWTRVRSDGYQHLPIYIQETSQNLEGRNTFLEGYRIESEARAVLSDQSRQRSSPPPFSPPPSLLEDDFPPEQRLAAWVHNIQHMGPESNRSHGRSNTDTSISLSSTPADLSEISTDVLELLGPNDPTRAPRKTQRRQDIDSLGQMIALQDVSSSLG